MKKSNPILIGIFVTSTVFLFLSTVALLGGGKFFKKSDTVIAYFDSSLQGLNVGSPVKYHGVTVGQVREIRIDINASDYDITIPVLIDLIPGGPVRVIGRDMIESYSERFLKLMVERGLRATLKTQSLLTGKLYIELSFQEDSAPVFHEKNGKYVEIPTTPSSLQEISDAIANLNIKELNDKATNILGVLENMTTQIDTVVQAPESKQRLDSFFTALDDLQSIIAILDSRLPELLNKSAIAVNKISTLSDNTDKLISHLDSQVASLSTNINQAMTRVSNAAAATEKLMVDLGPMTASDAALWAELNSTLKELGNTARSLRILSDKLYQDPNMLIFGSSTQETNHGQ